MGGQAGGQAGEREAWSRSVGDITRVSSLLKHWVVGGRCVWVLWVLLGQQVVGLSAAVGCLLQLSCSIPGSCSQLCVCVWSFTGKWKCRRERYSVV